MRVVVTGCSSFIGRHVARRLLAHGHHVTGSYRTPNAATESLKASGAALVQVDLGEENAASRLPREIDAIVHVAGVSVMPGVSSDDMLKCNVAGARNLIAYAKAAGAKRIAYASTLSVHGRVCEAVVDENTPVRDAGIYGASKYLAERLFAAEADALPGAAVRLPGVLGTGAHRAWIPTLVERLRANADVTIYGPDNRFNNAAHVDDLGDLFHNIVVGDAPGFPAFPVGASDCITVAAAVRLLAEAAGSNSAIRVAEGARDSFTISSDFAMEHFGYRPQTIEGMLRRYCAAP
jgi:nucleoside-diphosphate-sugar epimerase